MEKFRKIINLTASIIIIAVFSIAMIQMVIQEIHKPKTLNGTLSEKEIYLRRLTQDIIREKIETGTKIHVQSIQISYPEDGKNDKVMSVVLATKQRRISKSVLDKIHETAFNEANIKKENIAVVNMNEEYMESD